MKQLKFLMAALLMVMGVTLSSCLDSGEPDKTQSHFARVKQGDIASGYSPYFEDYLGNKLIPTISSLTQVEADGFKMSSSDFVIIKYEPVEVEGAAKAKAETVTQTINLLSAVCVDGPAPFIVESDEEMENTVEESAPIFALTYGGTYSPYLPSLYDKEILFLPIYYKMENKAEQLKQHKFNLVCSLEGVTSESSEIVFYVRHDKGTDDKTDALNLNLGGYNIRTAVARFAALTGNEPKKIVVKVKETGEYSSSNTMPEEYTTYSGEFKAGTLLTRNN